MEMEREKGVRMRRKRIYIHSHNKPADIADMVEQQWKETGYV